ncbi:hypothetical protein [Pseudomonas syringae]|uniref:hypothetical protein n=1 Tax=Pseudomonas syringae TaxID=317 RepID=UPI000465EF6D|nr:hypothetical protein [Pseudomonas syringae]MBS7419294.1 hypothetical protein [Pseudomonas syringae]NAO52178.1 hypothetical protein [Pseudomonas syringae]UOF18886.1 hypothetical protein N023_19925 [Pseudomonas syringae CC440]UZA81266.1 hypothetical protein EZZ79_20775 [Pseudomonas syringae]
MDIQLQEAHNLHRARFSFSSPRRDGGEAVGAKIRTSLTITSMGADTFEVVFSFDPKIGSAITGHIDSIPKGITASIAFNFVNAREVRVGTLSVDYKGIDGGKRREKFAYEINPQDPYVKIKQQIID